VLVDSQSFPAADGVVAADLAAFWPAAVVVLQRCLAGSAVLAADDPAAAWLFVAPACWNCPVAAVVVHLPYPWIAVDAVALVCWNYLVAAVVARLAVLWIAVAGAAGLAGALLVVDLARRDLPAVSAFQQAFLGFAAFPAPSVCPVDPGVKKLEQSNQEGQVLLL